MDEYPPAPSSLTQPRPSSNIDNNEKNQESYVKPPSYSDYVPTRPVSHDEDQQGDLMADDVPGEKPPSLFTQPRPASDINDYEENQASYAKPPSHSDCVPTRPGSHVEDPSGYEVYENTDEKPPTFGAVRPPNDSSDDKDSFDEINLRPLSYKQ